MSELPSKSALLSLPTLYTIYSVNELVTNYLNPYLGHLNLKGITEIADIRIDVIKARRTTAIAQSYSSYYKVYDVWEWGLVKYNNIAQLLIIKDVMHQGDPIYLVGDLDSTKALLHEIALHMEVVKDGFAYGSLDAVLNYTNDPSNITLLQ